MKYSLLSITFLCITVLSLCANLIASEELNSDSRTRISFNDNWQFARFGPMPDGSTRPEPGTDTVVYAFEVKASTTEDDNVAQLAFDDDKNTRWCASGGSTPQWLSVDLGKAHSLASINIIWEKESNYCYKVSGSNNNSKWTTLVDLTDNKSSEQAQKHKVNGQYRFLKIDISKVKDGAWASIFEVQIFDTAGNQIKNTATVIKAENTKLYDTDFDDSRWRTLDLPHDWGVEGPFRMDLEGNTGKLPWMGIGWYRKTFDVDMADRDKRFLIEFDGAMSYAKIWVNGDYVGTWPYGYSSFAFDITDFVKTGQENVIAVRLDNPPQSSRWYPGGGIYRNVWLTKTEGIHISHWGTYVTTPEISDDKAIVNAQITLENNSSKDQNITIGNLIVLEKSQPNENISGTDKILLKAGQKQTINCKIEVQNPKLWDIDNPVMYDLLTFVKIDDKIIDSYETSFGIRTIKFDVDKGFFLNGRRVQLKGVCMHHDLGPLGSAVNTRALERQIEILKDFGVNAIRTSHNPPTPELPMLCDKMGVLLIVEAFDCWERGKRANDYQKIFEDWHIKDISNMVLRDRNHPSVIMWSIGNEVPDQGTGQRGRDIAQSFTDTIHRLDPTRPTTVGCNHTGAGFSGFQKTVDIFGYNYKPGTYEKFYKENPTIPLYGSETASCISSRGEYFFPVEQNKGKGFFNYQVSSYDLYAPGWAYKPDIEFAAQDKYKFSSGEFVWTGFDYLGEPTPFNNDSTNLLNFASESEKKAFQAKMEAMGGKSPSRSSYFGIVDLCGFKKDRFYIYQAHWRPELPMAHILPHWNWPDRIGEITPVHVYTSGDEAELFVNGKSMGRKKKEQYEYRITWDEIKYQPGIVHVIAYKNGKTWAQDIVATTEVPAKISLDVDRSIINADGNDLAFVTVEIKDKNNLTVPRSDNLVKFEIEGPGQIVAVGNGDATSHEPFQASQRKAYNGMALVIIKSYKGKIGTITLTAKSDGLSTAKVKIATK
ncbi:MAG: DUF4982 domain-containing protein [Phycisphaerae bacterium]|nr:DUF4982 domain-containing protein [Phycisphaerae bacterium]